jgi:hypothetical protein
MENGPTPYCGASVSVVDACSAGWLSAYCWSVTIVLPGRALAARVVDDTHAS